MRILFSVFFIFIFLGEVTLDSSTSFVRSSADSYQTDPGFGDDGDSDSDSGAPVAAKTKSSPKLVEASAHAAVPCKDEVPEFVVPETVLLFAEFVLPVLNPPKPRIERPPIA